MSSGSNIVINNGIVTKLYKYRTFNKFADDIILNSSLWYANPLTFNDPFDMNPSFRQLYSKREIKKHIKDYIQTSESTKNMSFVSQEMFRARFEKLSNTSAKFVAQKNELWDGQISNTGVVSLSKHNDSILMWSHYSNNHTGLVFEFDYSLKKEFLLSEFPHKVDYVEELGLFSYAALSNERRKQMITILLSKYIDWTYEGEYRIIDLDFQGNKPFDKKLLTKIIFGLKASTEDMQKMVKLCQENDFEHVKFEKAEKVEGTFALQMVPYSG